MLVLATNGNFCLGNAANTATFEKMSPGTISKWKNATLGQTPESKPAPNQDSTLCRHGAGSNNVSRFFRNNQQLRATCQPPCQKSHLWMTSLKGPAGSAFCWSNYSDTLGAAISQKIRGIFCRLGMGRFCMESRPLQPSHTSGFVMIWQPQILQGETHELLKCQMSNS